MVEEIFKLFGVLALKGKEDVDDGIDETTEKAQKSQSKITEAFKKIGTAVVTYFAVDKIVAFGKTCVETAASVKASNSQFEQTFGDFADQADEAMGKVATSSGILKTRLQSTGTGIYAFAKASGMDSVQALSMMEDALQITADSAAYYDRSLESTAESLQSFLKGNFANDAALGVSCTETTRNIAANKLFKKSYNDLSEAQKQLTLLQMVKDANALSGAMGQASREADGYENVMGNLKESWKQFTAEVGNPILDRVVPIIQAITTKISGLTGKVPSLYQKLSNLKQKVQEIAEYAIERFQPSLEKIQDTIDWVKEKLQPLIEKLKSFKENINFSQVATDTLKSTIDFLASATENAIDFVEKIVTGFENMKKWAEENETTITILAIAVGTLTTAIAAYNAVQAIKNAGGIVEIAQLAATAIGVGALTAAETAHTIAAGIATAATTAFGVAVNFLTSPITLVILAIGALIAVGVLLYKNWDSIKAKAIEVFAKIKEFITGKVDDVKNKFFDFINWIGDKFSGIKDKITEPFKKGAEAIGNIWSSIKSVFKLPHFTFSGSLNPLNWNSEGLPKVGVEWYAKGGIMNQPTVFGINPATGRQMVGGEAGAEAIAPIDTLLGYIRVAVAEQNSGLNNILQKILDILLAYFPQFAEMMEKDIVFDDGTIAARLTPAIDKNLSDEETRRRRGN